MEEQDIAKHLQNSLLGKFRLKLLKEISGTEGFLPNAEKVKQYVLDEYNSNQIIGQLYASLLTIDRYSREAFSNLKMVSQPQELLYDLEKAPFNQPYFVEIFECPELFPSTIGILISCSELVGGGYVYSITFMGEEKFPDFILGHLEVRTNRADPQPIFSIASSSGHDHYDLLSYKESLLIPLALKVLGYFNEKNKEFERREKAKDIVRTTKSFYLSDGIQARFLRQRRGRIEMALIINETTSAEQLRSAWGAIDAVRTRLKDFQGTDLSKSYNVLLYNFSQMKEKGWSYNTLAMDINYDCYVNLLRAADEIPSLEAPVLKSDSLSSAFLLLKAMRMKDDDIWYWLIPGLQEIRDDRAPWSLQSGPIDGQRVRDALRQWKREKETKKIVIKTPPKQQFVPVKELADQDDELYWSKAKKLLEDTYPGSFGKYQNMVKETIKKTGVAGMVIKG